MTLLSPRPAPPPEAYRAKPLSVAEIDAHPDGARIWATVLAMRDEHDKGREEAYDDGFVDGRNAAS
jgi:hypothetical protein